MPNSLYPLYEMSYAALTPVRLGAEAARDLFQNPGNPLSATQAGRTVAASADMLHRLTRRFDQPAFGIRRIKMGDGFHAVREKDVMDLPFCRLKHFVVQGAPKRPKMLVCAPLSGHFATLLRGTVEALLPHHDVYITDWKNARNVPLSRGYFDLDDCIDYHMQFVRFMGPDTDMFAVCQPSVPVLLAVSVMNTIEPQNAPRSMILMGGPIDTRINPTEVNKLARDHDISWFRRHAISTVPIWYAGALRPVYPGFLQLTGFMSMNLDRHIDSYFTYFQNLVKGDGQSAEKHREFYNEYLAVMDIPAEFYLQTVERAFQQHLLPKRQYKWRGILADPGAITRTALLCIEGELDDISAAGQTEAAMDLCNNLPASMKKHHLQKKAGHYGLFNGTRWREEVRPLMTNFILSLPGTPAKKAKPFKEQSAAEKKALKKKIARRTKKVPPLTPVVGTAAIVA